MNAPEAIWKLAQERQLARAAKEFALADQLRDEIELKGWEVVDISGSFELHRKVRHSTIENIALMKPFPLSESEISIGMVVQGFPEDAVTTIRSIRNYSDVPIAIVCIGEVGALEEEIDANLFLVQITGECGWGAAANALLQNVPTKYLVIMDPSTLFTEDAIAPDLAKLRDGEYAAV
ncbi:MAG TPA: hypothetical protein VF307_05935, partial [Candidatus Nanopelagicaceae bacterium]